METTLEPLPGSTLSMKAEVASARGRAIDGNQEPAMPLDR